MGREPPLANPTRRALDGTTFFASSKKALEVVSFRVILHTPVRRSNNSAATFETPHFCAGQTGCPSAPREARTPAVLARYNFKVPNDNKKASCRKIDRLASLLQRKPKRCFKQTHPALPTTVGYTDVYTIKRQKKGEHSCPPAHHPQHTSNHLVVDTFMNLISHQVTLENHFLF